MNKEEFYNELDDLAAELYEKYINALSNYSESMISEIEESSTHNIKSEVASYIASKSTRLKQKLEKDTKEVKERITSSGGYNKNFLEKSKQELISSFNGIYNSAKQSIRSILNSMR